MKKKDIFSKKLFYSYIESHYDTNITPLVIGYEVCEPNKSIIYSNKSCFILHFVLNGSGTIFTRNKDYNIEENTVFIIPPHAKFRYVQNKQNPWTYIWFEFNGTIVNKLLNDIKFSPDNFIFKLKKQEKENNKIKYLFNQLVTAQVSNLDLLTVSVILQIFAFLINDFKETEYNQSDIKMLTIKNIRRYIEDHYSDQTLTINSIADAFYFSPSYVSRLFKNEFNISPVQYLIEYRLQKSIELLNSKKFTISQIADYCGYKNQFYYSREFKKFFGCPPTKYKQKGII
jgi:AraC family transcriptional regulator of arabinose operon